MEQSILTSIKKSLGIAAEYTHFDLDIVMHINSVFMTLTQIGVGSSRARLENKRIEHEIKLMETKRKSLEDTEEIKVLYEDALKAMRNYAGQGDPDEY